MIEIEVHAAHRRVKAHNSNNSVAFNTCVGETPFYYAKAEGVGPVGPR